jgi:hypothetical protein
VSFPGLKKPEVIGNFSGIYDSKEKFPLSPITNVFVSESDEIIFIVRYIL